MNILVLTYFFRPDLSAGSFRATPFVESLLRRVPADSVVDVVTTMPHRYHSFTADEGADLQHEAHTKATVHRIQLPRHRGGFVDQVFAFVRYAREVKRYVRARHYDLVFGTSSRLMTATLAAHVARSKKAALYLDIRDIFADTMPEVLPRRVAKLAKPVFDAAERWTVNAADKINLVSPGFADYFTGRYPNQQYSFITNGVDREFMEAARKIRDSQSTSVGPITILYAGNIGAGQGLDAIVPELAHQLGENYQFKLIGDGGRRSALEEAIGLRGLKNVEVLSPMQRDRLLLQYQMADVLFLHLNDFEAFKKVLPSKVFEYAALGKPIWAGVAGYAARFISSQIENAAVFSPCDVAAALESFKDLKMGWTARTEFVKNYDRNKVSDLLAQDVLTLAV